MEFLKKGLGIREWGMGIIFSFVFLLTGCASMVQKGGEILEGSAFEEKTIALYRSNGRENATELKYLQHKDGEDTIEITGNAWPGFALRGSKPADDGTFELRTVRFLSSHVNGWNDVTIDLLGNAHFFVSAEVAGRLSISGEVERVQISSGKIRLKSNRLTGTAALTPLRNRRERILTLTEWMQTQEAMQPVFANQKEFENYWANRFFPELVSKKKRPPVYSVENAEWERVDSVKWNRSYTEQLFPGEHQEELRKYRNSGALLRDWEEALPWIYMEYSWNNIISSFSEIDLLKVRR